ncbi:MAG: hypothetical protein AB1500_07320 [Bacillota bacterium]
MKTGSTIIQWDDYEGFILLETTSEKLVETLLASGIRWFEKDDETGIYYFQTPTAWLRLRVPKQGLIKLGWYLSTRQLKRGILSIIEKGPRLYVVK